MRKLIKTWPEFISVPVALLLWFLTPQVLRWIDPVAAPFDDGILHAIAFSILAVMIFSGLAFAGIKFNFPHLFDWYSKEQNFFSLFKDYQRCEPHQRLQAFLLLYTALLLSFCLVLIAIL